VPTVSPNRRLLALAGYDPEVVRALGPSSARQLSSIALAHGLPIVLMGAAAGYATQLAHGVVAVSVAAGLAFGAFVANLLRVSVAGGGMAPHKTLAQSERFRPAMPPVLVLSLLSALLAQPAMLPLFAGELEPQVAAHRAQLLRQHRGDARADGVTEGSEAGRLRRQRAERYARNVARASFEARRVTLVWQRPLRPSLFTLAFVLLCTSPLLLARLPLVSAVRHYELLRRDQLQVLLHALDVATTREVHAELSRYASYDASHDGPPPAGGRRAPGAGARA